MKSLKFNDRVYGEYEFTDPVLIELIKSKAVQRLKEIAQYGVPDEFYHKKGYSRFEHNIGVAILLAKLGASIEEQIAGILHDVSHTAFSHVIDWVIGSNKEEDFQDKIFFETICKDKQILSILKKYNFELENFKHLDNFPLLEQPIPNLCADRIDYCLREIVADGDKKTANTCFNDLTIHNNKICFKSKKVAKIFGKIFLKLQREHWAGDQAVSRYYALAQILKEALNSKIIIFEDFFKNDNYIINKLRNCKNDKIKEKLRKLQYGEFKIKKKDKKLRFVDPVYLEKGKELRLSTTDSEFKSLLRKLKSKV